MKLGRYIAKCVLGCLASFSLAYFVPFLDIHWLMISTVLVLTPDSREALPLAWTRIGANLIASTVSLLMLSIGGREVLLVSVAIALTVAMCYLLRVIAGCRSAMAAVVIIMLHEPGLHFWDAAVGRTLNVVCGCLLGLLLTIAFHCVESDRSRALFAARPGE